MNHTHSPMQATELYVNELVVTRLNGHLIESVSALGFIENGSLFNEVEVSLSGHELQRLLVANGAEGKAVWNNIMNAIEVPHSSPLRIDVVQAFGLTTVFKAREILLKAENNCGFYRLQSITVS